MISEELSAGPKCGDCEYFDIRDCKGVPIGNTNSEEGFVRNGLCRAPGGLVLGLMNDLSNCKQPPTKFKPIRKVS